MDHQIEHDADIGGAEGVGGKPLGLDVLGAYRRLLSAVRAGLNRSMWPTWSKAPKNGQA